MPCRHRPQPFEEVSRFPQIWSPKAVESAPQALKDNFNRLVRTALEEYIETRKARAFAEQMQAMAADPDVQREITTINKEFRHADIDGLAEGK